MPFPDSPTTYSQHIQEWAVHGFVLTGQLIYSCISYHTRFWHHSLLETFYFILFNQSPRHLLHYLLTQHSLLLRLITTSFCAYSLFIYSVILFSFILHCSQVQFTISFTSATPCTSRHITPHIPPYFFLLIGTFFKQYCRTSIIKKQKTAQLWVTLVC